MNSLDLNISVTVGGCLAPLFDVYSSLFFSHTAAQPH